MNYRRILLCVYFAFTQLHTIAQEKLKVIFAGLTHDHVNRMLSKAKAGEIILLGIVEADKDLCNRKKNEYELPDSIFYNSLSTAINKNKPDLVMAFNAPVEHLSIIETCLPHHIPVIVEKPLCFTNTEVQKIKKLSDKYKTKVYTNYPSQWYTSFMELFKRADEVGAINKIIMRGGHKGPKEVGCSNDFLNWLTDSTKNGGGAITDFGCYGASAIVNLMNNQKPVSVYAIAHHKKTSVYPKVDDDATIVVNYKNTTGVIEASWNWPYVIMDVELYGKDAYLHASQFNDSKEQPTLQFKNEKETKNIELSTPQYKDEIAYLTAVIKNNAPDNNALLSLEHNIKVVAILDAARRSLKEKRLVFLK